MYLMAGMAVASLISSHQQQKAQTAAMVADAKLQRARLQTARLRATEDYQTNSQRLKQAAQKREMQVEENRVKAGSQFKATFAGSGISGTSMNELDDEINTQAARNKIENRNALDQQLGDLTKNYVNTMNDSADAAASISTTAPSTDVIGNIAGAAGAAASVQGLDQKFSSWMGL